MINHAGQIWEEGWEPSKNIWLVVRSLTNQRGHIVLNLETGLTTTIPEAYLKRYNWKCLA